MSIATKTGDDGTTALLFGRRVAKTDVRIVANGAIDELNAALGVARAHLSGRPLLAETLLGIQKELVTIMGELAVVPADRERYAKAGHVPVTAAMTERLSALVVEVETQHEISYRHWATPGATRESAFLDLARTICRRAEREVVNLSAEGYLANPEIVRYLNRLSDLCWLYARWIETQAGVG